MEASSIPTGPGANPVHAVGEKAPKLNRILPFFKSLFAMPHLFVLMFLFIGQYFVVFIAWFAILFTGKYPKGMFDFVEGVFRWTWRVNFYAWTLGNDKYPPFTMDSVPDYPADFNVEYPARLSRLLIFVKTLLVIPHVFVLIFLFIWSLILLMISPFIILFTAKLPDGIFNFQLGLLRWVARIQVYTNLMTDKYPPFSLK